MDDEANPYEVLGVPRDVNLEMVRAAFRKAALQCHPDTNPDPTAEAEEQFRNLVKAYQTISRTLGYSPWHDPEKFSAADFARLDTDWFADQRPLDDSPPQPPPPGTPKVKEARFDELLAFLAIWFVAVGMGVVTAYIVMRFQIVTERTEGVDLGNILIVASMTLGIYVVLVAAGLVALVLTRKTVWLIARYTLEFRRRRALPKPTTKLPPPKAKLPPKQIK